MADQSNGEISEETRLLYDLIGDTTLLTPVVLIGASAMIPVPFLDDVAKKYLEKRLFRLIAQKEHRELNKEELSALVEEPSKGCFAVGCFLNVLIYPIKKILRKLFFFLEVKRAVDQATTALAKAWLFQLAFRRTLWEPGAGAESASRLREIMNTACEGQGVRPLEVAISHAFEETKGSLSEFAAKFTKKKPSTEEEVEKVLETLEKDQEKELAGFTRKLTESLDELKGGYLETFAGRFEKDMESFHTTA